MTILSLRVHINVKTPYHLLYNPSIIKILSKFPKLAKEFQRGICGGGIAFWPVPPLATALVRIWALFIYFNNKSRSNVANNSRFLDLSRYFQHEDSMSTVRIEWFAHESMIAQRVWTWAELVVLFWVGQLYVTQGRSHTLDREGDKEGAIKIHVCFKLIIKLLIYTFLNH